MCRVILGEFCSKWVKASSIQFCWVHRAFGSVPNFVSNSIDFKKFLLFFDLRSSQSFFPRLSFMCGLLAEGEWWCVQTHKHTHKYMHTYTSYLLIKGFKLTGEKARLRWKYQFLKYLALISDWYTVLYIVLLKFTFVTGSQILHLAPWVQTVHQTCLATCEIIAGASETSSVVLLLQVAHLNPQVRAALGTARKARSHHQMLHFQWT